MRDDGFFCIVVVGEDSNTVNPIFSSFAERFYIVIAQVCAICYQFMSNGTARTDDNSAYVFLMIRAGDYFTFSMFVICPYVFQCGNGFIIENSGISKQYNNGSGDIVFSF